MALAETDGFFEGELVEGVHGHFDPGGFDGGVCGVHARFDLGVLVGVNFWRGRGRYGIVDDPLDGDEDAEGGHCGDGGDKLWW